MAREAHVVLRIALKPESLHPPASSNAARYGVQSIFR
jgi:hypothetical protein